MTDEVVKQEEEVVVENVKAGTLLEKNISIKSMLSVLAICLVLYSIIDVTQRTTRQQDEKIFNQTLQKATDNIIQQCNVVVAAREKNALKSGALLEQERTFRFLALSCADTTSPEIVLNCKNINNGYASILDQIKAAGLENTTLKGGL
jgi:hypothetical protein